MKLFATPDYFKRFIDPLCASDPDMIPGDFEIGHYPNGETYAKINENINDEDCFVVSSVAPPDSQLVSLLVLINALQKNKAKSIQIFLPYLAYSRQDEFISGEDVGIALIGSLLKAAGANKIITIDAHSDRDGKLIGLPLVSIDPSFLFEPKIRDLRWDNITIVAPDEGAIKRAQLMSDKLGHNRPVTYFIKQKIDNKIANLKMIGDIGPNVVIVDDIIDSGQTLISVSKMLLEKGAQKIIIAATHGLFTDRFLDELSKLNVELLLVSDTCPEVVKQKNPIIKMVDLERLLPIALIEQLKEPST